MSTRSGADATYVEMQHITDGILFLASSAAEAINGLVLPHHPGRRLAMQLAGRVALVTGAGRRLGRAFAEALAGRGMTMALHYNAVEGAAEVPAQRDRGAGRAGRVPPGRPGGCGGGARARRAGWSTSLASWTCWSTRPP